LTPAIPVAPAVARTAPPAPHAAVFAPVPVVQRARVQSSTPGPAFLGTLAVQSEPAGAAVFVNQNYVGETPLQLPRLRAGSHVVWVQEDGYRRWTAGVTVPADRVTRIRVNLERQENR
jgi:hypothetical protein